MYETFEHITYFRAAKVLMHFCPVVNWFSKYIIERTERRIKTILNRYNQTDPILPIDASLQCQSGDYDDCFSNTPEESLICFNVPAHFDIFINCKDDIDTTAQNWTNVVFYQGRYPNQYPTGLQWKLGLKFPVITNPVLFPSLLFFHKL